MQLVGSFGSKKMDEIYKKLQGKYWWNYLHDDLKELIKESALMAERVENWKEKFNDYSFIVFPAAKAYEGFLKTLFLDLGFISENDFYGQRFRVGKALNPALDTRYREKESVYDQMTNFCKGKELADYLWDTWKQCRNLLFHWFPGEKNAISYKEAQEKILLIFNAMDMAFESCVLKGKKGKQKKT